MALLTVRDLSVSFDTRDGAVRAVNDVSFSLEAGKVLALLGESGTGSTSARARSYAAAWSPWCSRSR